MPCGLQLTGGYRPKLNVATKAGMFTPFLGTKKAQKNIHVCWFNTPAGVLENAEKDTSLSMLVISCHICIDWRTQLLVPYTEPPQLPYCLLPKHA